jgi:hypothetical protein
MGGVLLQGGPRGKRGDVAFVGRERGPSVYTRWEPYRGRERCSYTVQLTRQQRKTDCDGCCEGVWVGVRTAYASGLSKVFGERAVAPVAAALARALLCYFGRRHRRSHGRRVEGQHGRARRSKARFTATGHFLEATEAPAVKGSRGLRRRPPAQRHRTVPAL